MRLIDADMLCKYCNNNINHSITPNEIMRMPFIDAEPVKHGCWISKGICIECSNCKETLIRDNIEEAAVYENGLPEYCPRCGARMDGGAK